MQEIHITEIDKLCEIVGVQRIPSNYSDNSVPEKEYYEELEQFLVQRSDGTPMTACYSELESAALPDYIG